MRKGLHIIYSTIILLVLVSFMANGQGNSINEGLVLTNEGKVGQNISLSVDGVPYTSNAEGKILLRGYDAGRRPQKVYSLKEGYIVKNYNTVGGKLQVIITVPRQNTIQGQVKDEKGNPVTNIDVSLNISGRTFNVKTDKRHGIFKLSINSSYRPNENTKFRFEDSELVTSPQFKFIQEKYVYKFTVRKKPTYLVLNKEFTIVVRNGSGRKLSGVPFTLGGTTYRTRRGEATSIQRKLGDELVFTAHEIVKIDSIASINQLAITVKEIEGVDFTPTPDLVVIDTPVVKDTIIQRVVETQNPFLANLGMLNKFYDSLELFYDEANAALKDENLTKSQKDYIIENLTKLNERLTDEQKEDADLQNKYDILLKENTSIEEKQRIDREALAAQQAENRRQLIIGLIAGSILLAITTFIALLARQFRKQRNQIGTQKTELEVLNVDLKEKNDQITDSIRAAELIQEAILPIAADIRSTFLENFILFRPKDIVSGDFYWFKKSTDEHGREMNYIAAIDCTGHGVPGAFMSMIGNTLLNEIINKKSATETNEILELLDQGIVAALKQDTTNSDEGMDVCFCRIAYNDDDTVELQYTGAKRPLYIFMEGSNELLKVDGTARSIGGRQQARSRRRNPNVKKKRAKKPFDVNNFVLRKGSEVYLSSDGLVDQNGKSNGTEKPKFGTKKLLETLKEVHTNTMTSQGETFNKLLDEHQEEAEQRDDITLIGLRL